jgi:hypothetical protein
MIFVGRPCGSGASDAGFRRKHAISVLYTPLFSGLLSVTSGFLEKLKNTLATLAVTPKAAKEEKAEEKAKPNDTAPTARQRLTTLIHATPKVEPCKDAHLLNAWHVQEKSKEQLEKEKVVKANTSHGINHQMHGTRSRSK